MARLLILLAAVAGCVWFLHWFRTTPAPRVARLLRQAALWGFIAVLILAAATGRLNPLLALLAAAIPLVLRLVSLLTLLPALRQALRALGLGSLLGAPPAGAQAAGRQGVSTLRTRFLDMELDHASGAMDGSVREGPFQGQRLSGLTLEQLLRLHEFYLDADAQSLAMLEAYLDREQADDWRDRAAAGHSGAGAGPAAGGGRLTLAEAWSILGLEPGADAETIRTAHRRLMQRLHPDRGGSHYLAAKINEAKRLLLDETQDSNG